MWQPCELLYTCYLLKVMQIATVVGQRPPGATRSAAVAAAYVRCHCLCAAIAVPTHHHACTAALTQHAVISATPTLYVLNAAALLKPGAVDHLASG